MGIRSRALSASLVGFGMAISGIAVWPQSGAAAAQAPAHRAAPPVVQPAIPTHVKGWTPPATGQAPKTPVVPGWTSLGPQPGVNLNAGSAQSNSSGRVTSIVVDPTSGGQTVFAGTAGGGVWKSTNGGTSWTELTDTQASLAIGAMTISQDGQTIYAGTGEDNFNADALPGAGVLKSTDGGASWTLLGASALGGKHVGGMAIDKNTSGSTQVVLASTDGGLYRSTDGGTTWTLNTMIPTLLTGAGGNTPGGGLFEVWEDPNNPAQFWITAGDSCFTEQAAVLTSSDDGATWALAGGGFAPGGGRIALGLGNNAGTTVAYAATADCKGDLTSIQTSLNGGTSWTSQGAAAGTGLINYFDLGNAQGNYDNFVAVDPHNYLNAVFGGVTVLTTTNGGTSFVDAENPYGEAGMPQGNTHPDNHAAAFYGTTAGFFYLGNDGGMWKTAMSMGGTGQDADWNNLNATLNTIQFYHGAALDATHVFGGAQDNGSMGLFPGGSTAPGWLEYGGGDGGWVALDPTSSNIFFETPDKIYSESTSAPLAYTNAAGPCDQAKTLPACSQPTDFTAPFVMDPTNPQHLYAATNHVYATTTGGVPQSGWTSISPDLTTGTGGDHVTTMVDNGGTIMTASGNGKVEMTTNNGASWSDISTGTALPTPMAGQFVIGDGHWIGGVAFNPGNPNEAWVGIAGVGVQHVWHTTNANAGAGTTWTAVDMGAQGIPTNQAVLSLSYDPASSKLIAGTLNGVLVCTGCTGAASSPTWAAPGSGLPNTAVFDVNVSTDGTALYAWTHGRGAWSLPWGTTTPPVGGVYNPVTPFRVWDTRTSSGPLGPGGTHTVQISGTGTPAIPSTATAVTVNLTGIQPSQGTYLSVGPAGKPGLGSSSNLNLNAGVVQANLATVALSASGQVTVFNSVGSVDVAMDVEGYFTPSASTPPSMGTAGTFHPIAPVRVCDTRTGTGSPCAGTPLTPGHESAAVNLSAVAGIPTDGSARAVVFNLTAVQGDSGTYLAAYPPDGTGACPAPSTSNLNVAPGAILPNRVMVPIGPSGSNQTTVCIFNAVGTMNFIIDVNGWFGSGADAPGALFYPATPQRICDTRGGTGNQCTGNSIAQHGTLTLSGVGTAAGDPLTPVAIVANTTAIQGTANTFLSLFPAGPAPNPLTSDLNPSAGQIIANLAIVSLGGGGQLDVYNDQGIMNVALDAEGWFQ